MNRVLSLGKIGRIVLREALVYSASESTAKISEFNYREVSTNSSATDNFPMLTSSERLITGGNVSENAPLYSVGGWAR